LTERGYTNVPPAIVLLQQAVRVVSKVTKVSEPTDDMDIELEVVVEEFPGETLVVTVRVWVNVEVLPEETLNPIVVPRAKAITAITEMSETTCLVCILLAHLNFDNFALRNFRFL